MSAAVAVAARSDRRVASTSCDGVRFIAVPSSRPNSPLDSGSAGRASHAGEIARQLAEAGRELVVVVEGERPALVQGAQREPVVARETVRHAAADDLLDIVPADLGVGVEAVDHTVTRSLP